jgi:outer membrane protein OmpA-like peptidoglycan-associated protein
MERYSNRNPTQDSLNIFQPFTDLMSNAFMIITFFLLLSLLQVLVLKEQNKSLQEKNKNLQFASPIIIDEQSGKYKFQSGRAELSPALSQYISTDIVSKIQSATKQHKIAFIQVIGHTDGQAINHPSNLDEQLELAVRGQKPVGKLQAGSNSDLGLMRAIAVIQTLQKSGQLKNVDFRAYSAAQLYLPSGKLAPISRTEDESRRRIEIRFVPPGQQN